MSTLTAFARDVYTRAVREAVLTPPLADDRWSLSCARDALEALDPDAELLSMALDVSIDAGQTWIMLGGIGTAGGVHDRGDGAGIARSATWGWLPGAGSPGRRVRVVFDAKARITSDVLLATDALGSRMRVQPAGPRRSVAWDTGGVQGYSVASSVNLGLTVGNNADRYLLAFFAMRSETPSSVKWNSVAMSALDSVNEASNGSTEYVYETTAPAAASANVSVSFPHTKTGALMAASLHGVDQATPHGTVAKGTATSTSPDPSLSVSGSAGGMDVFALHIYRSSGPETITGPGGDQTERGEYEDASNGSGSFATKAGGANTFAYAVAGGTGAPSITMLGVPVLASGGGGAVPVLYHQRQAQGMAA